MSALQDAWADSPHAPDLDQRDAAEFAAELMRRRAGYVPEWQPGERGAGAALVQIAAGYLATVTQRLNRAPDKAKLAFLDRLGVRPLPATAARAPMIFRLAPNMVDMRINRGTRIAAPPPPGSQNQIVFETEQAVAGVAARLVEVISLWPGRDAYIDHSEAHAAERPFQPFRRADLAPTPHALYLAHETLLALAGQSRVTVRFDLATGGSDRLDLEWQYWDGKIWRQFLDMRPQCAGDTPLKLDGTDGLRRSGSYLLLTDCAQAEKTTVAGVEGYWVRGLLTETVPPNPARILPAVNSLSLGTEITRPLSVSWGEPTSLRTHGERNQGVVHVTDALGAALPGVLITLSDGSKVAAGWTNETGSIQFRNFIGEVEAIVGDQPQRLKYAPPEDSAARLTIALAVTGIAWDKAAANDTLVDLSKPFYPFGLAPQVGATFAFSSTELFTKPGARVRLYIQPAPTAGEGTPAPSGFASAPERFAHVVVWEYWNGERWSPLDAKAVAPIGTAWDGERWVFLDSTISGQPGQDTPFDFTAAGFVELTVPEDLAPTTIAGQAALWMRVRLLSGSYGVMQSIAFSSDGGVEFAATGSPSFRFPVLQAPALGAFCFGYTWQQGPFPAEHVIAYNDFQYRDYTDAARWPGPPFQPFVPVTDTTPALYLGFDGPLPVDDIGILFDIVEQPGEGPGPALRWEYWDGFAWQGLTLDDETRGLRVPGIARFIGPRDARPLPRFGTERTWVRARLAEDGLPGAPVLQGIYPNAVWAAQQQTVVDEPLGLSTGQPDQVFAFRQIPVLPGDGGAAERARAAESEAWEREGQWVEVRELSGLRANVEWRLLALELAAGNPRAVAELERRLAEEGTETDIQQGDLRLVRNRLKEVTEVWVRWRELPTLLGTEPTTRAFVVDRARGRIYLGDGREGMAPPAGAALLARYYRTGGGEAGNLPKSTITQLLAPIGGIEGVWNARPAEGGADGEGIEALLRRGPALIRSRGRALTAQDVEALAYEASAAVAVARAIGCAGADGWSQPGAVTVVIIPRSADARPLPSFGLRERVRQHIAAAALATLADAGSITVTGPDYVAVDVEVTIVPLPGTQAGAVESAVREALLQFLHPLRGGPQRQGWAPGRAVHLSDVAALIERVAGVDYIRELALLTNGKRAGEVVTIRAEQTVVAGELRLKLVGS